MDITFAQILAHATRDFPNEACGLVVKTDFGALEVIECDNRSPFPGSSFMIDPAVIAQNIEKTVAIYHSHPNRDPQPSDADIASAHRCGLTHIIASIPSNEIYTYTPNGNRKFPLDGRYFCYGVFDCLSIVQDYYQQELGIDIDTGTRKEWGWWNNLEEYYSLANGLKAQGFYPINEGDVMKIGDVILMTVEAKCPNHLAVYVGDSIILHHPGYTIPSRYETYGHYWRHSTNAIFRHERRRALREK